MRTTITAVFDTVDEAERAVSRLRHSIRDLRVETAGEERSALPADAPYTASVYYPWRISMAGNELNSMPKELGSRVLYTSDLMGLPLYHDGETEVRLKTDPKDAERVRGLLLNMGGSNIRVS